MRNEFALESVGSKERREVKVLTLKIAKKKIASCSGGLGVSPATFVKCVSSVTAKPWSDCGTQYGHTTTFLFEYCRRNTQGDDTAPTGFKNVCARNTKERPDAKVLTYKCYCCDKKLKVQECDDCGLCGVGVLFSPPARMSACSGASESLTLFFEKKKKKHRGNHLSRTRPPDIPLRRRRRLHGKGTPCYPLFWLTFSDKILIAR